MGTNYYIHLNTCNLCGRSDPEIHLGKSSFGWSFALQANEFTMYKNWEEMKEWLKGKEIKDEYGDTISVKGFIRMVEGLKKVKDPENVDWGSRPPVEIDGYRFHTTEFS